MSNQFSPENSIAIYKPFDRRPGGPKSLDISPTYQGKLTEQLKKIIHPTVVNTRLDKDHDSPKVNLSEMMQEESPRARSVHESLKINLNPTIRRKLLSTSTIGNEVKLLKSEKDDLNRTQGPAFPPSIRAGKVRLATSFTNNKYSSEDSSQTPVHSKPMGPKLRKMSLIRLSPKPDNKPALSISITNNSLKTQPVQVTLCDTKSTASRENNSGNQVGEVKQVEMLHVSPNVVQQLNFSSLVSRQEKIIRESSQTMYKGNQAIIYYSIIWETGTTYFGELKESLFHGDGVLQHCSGYSIKGRFANGEVHGKAEYVSGKRSYVGDWEHNVPHGIGIERVEGIYRYEGTFFEGAKQGKGVMTLFKKGVYDGEFTANNFHGHGIFVWNDGKKYVGSWNMGHMHGKGTMTWPDGRKFEGRYYKSKKEGFGVFTWADGKHFAGTWRGGKQQGVGNYKPLEGHKVKATWREGKVEVSDRPNPSKDNLVQTPIIRKQADL
jgi:hypothetical protein